MKIVCAILAVCLITSFSASAKTIGLREMSCGEFQALSKDDLTYVMAFLDGYYRLEDDALIVDQDNSAVRALADYSIANPTEGLIAAADSLLRK